MKVIERMIQELSPGQNAALNDIDKRYDALEGPMGFPPKRRYWCISGPHHTNTIIIEREWESMAAMEAAYDKLFANPDIQALWEEASAVVKILASNSIRPPNHHFQKPFGLLGNSSYLKVDTFGHQTSPQIEPPKE